MSERLEVIITGKDGVSRIFQEVSREAKAAGTAVEAAGTSGSKGMKQLDDAATKSGESIKRSSDDARRAAIDFDKFGAAAVAVGGFLTVAGNSALDQIQTIEGLRSAYGDAADEMLAFADQMAATTIFNDDDILRGERYFATLANNYDLTISQVQQLMQTTADLASAYGTTFEDASSRITAAIRGEGEAAEYLGLTMNQQAIDRENLTLKMSNQEAAQFRLQALYAQTDVYAGTAQRVLQSEVGDRAELTNMIQDNTQALANFIGPYNAIIAGAATGAVGIAQFAGGFGALASGIRTVTAASAAFVATPLGLTVTGIGLALTAVVGTFMATTNASKETAAAWAEAEASGQSLTDQINQMALAGDMFNARFAKDFEASVFGQVDWFRDELEKVLRGENLDTQFGQTIVDLIPDNLLGPAAAAERQAFLNGLMPTPQDEIELNAAVTSLFSLMTNPNIDGSKLQQEMLDIFTAFDNMPDGTPIQVLIDGLISLESQTMQTLFGIETITQSNWDYTDSVNGAANATGNLSAMLPILTQHYARMAGEMLGAGGVAAITDDMDNFGTSTARAITQMALLAAEEAKVAAGFFNMGAAARSGLGEMAESAIDPVLERMEELQALADGLSGAGMAGAQAIADQAIARYQELYDLLLSITGMDDPLAQWNASSGGSQFSQAAVDMNNAAEAAENLFRVIVGNTNAIASQAQGVADWADELIGVQGEWAIIDDLLSAGIITLNEYNAAQQAQISIAQDNASIQSYVQEIQAMQAPLIAESTSALENQMEVIAGMPAQQQLVALAWMDSATAAKALEIATMATAVANGELGASGEAAFASYLEGIAAVDPAMKALLIDMGLIEEGANGEITINMDGAEGAISDIDRLTSAIVGLLDYLDNGVLDESFHLDVDTDPAITALSGVQDALSNIDGTTASASVDISVKGPNGETSLFDGGQDHPLAGLIGDLSGKMGGEHQIEVEVVPVIRQGGGLGGDGTGGAGWFDALPPAELPVTPVIDQTAGAPTLDPIEVDVVPVFTTSGGGDPTGMYGGGTASLPPIEVPAVPVFNEDMAAGIPAMDPIDVPVNLVVDEGRSSLTEAVGTWQETVIDGPTFAFLADSADVSAEAQVWAASFITGPTFQFYPDATAVEVLADLTAGVSYSGPTFNFVADDSSVRAAIGRYTNGAVIATQYVDIVTRTFGSGVFGQAHGGIVEMAMGGTIPVMTSEAGTELLHLATGGSIPMIGKGVRYLPPGTFVEPANSARDKLGGGGITVKIDVHGNIYGIGDLAEQVSAQIVPAIAEATGTRFREQGVRW